MFPLFVAMVNFALGFGGMKRVEILVAHFASQVSDIPRNQCVCIISIEFLFGVFKWWKMHRVPLVRSKKDVGRFSGIQRA